MGAALWAQALSQTPRIVAITRTSQPASQPAGRPAGPEMAAEVMDVDSAPAAAAAGCFNYAVTAQKPTGVLASLCGNFTSPTDLNLVLA